MPSLIDVAAHFDDISVYNGYTNALLFKGQMSSFREAAPDGTLSEKRILSVRPSVTMPARFSVKMLGDLYLVGNSNLDGIFDTAIRKTVWTKKVTESMARLTPREACLSSAGYNLYVSKAYLKDTVNGVTDSEYDPFWIIYTSQDETAAKGLYYRSGSTIYRTRTCHLELSGFWQNQCDELDAGALVSVSVAGGTYNPVTDTTSGGPTTTPALMFEPVKDYEYATRADPKINSGDMTVIMPISTTIGAKLTIASVQYQVITVHAEMDAWNCLVRRQ